MLMSNAVFLGVQAFAGSAAGSAGYNYKNHDDVSKYVDSVWVDNSGTSTTGTITVTFSATLPQADGQTLTFIPQIRNETAGYTDLLDYEQNVDKSQTSGNIDWACLSDEATTATANGMATTPAGTLLAQYAPTECR